MTTNQSDNNILEGNKLIAEFMGEKYRWEYWYQDNKGDEWISIYATEAEASKRLNHSGHRVEGVKPRKSFYHSSWNALMPVWNKCKDIGLWMNINNHDRLWLEKSKEIEDAIVREINCERAAMLISQLIKWYNTLQS